MGLFSENSAEHPAQAMIMSVVEFCAPAVDSTQIQMMSNIAPHRRQEAVLMECQTIENNSELPIFDGISSAPIGLRLKSWSTENRSGYFIETRKLNGSEKQMETMVARSNGTKNKELVALQLY